MPTTAKKLRVWTEIDYFNQDGEITPNCFEIIFINQAVDDVSINGNLVLSQNDEFRLTFPCCNMIDVTRFRIKFLGSGRNLVVITRRIIKEKDKES